jgi:photosystem I subunit 11
MKLFKGKIESNFLNAHQSRFTSTNISTKAQLIKPLNGDPFIGMVETPVTTAPIVVNYLSNLPAYRIGVSPLLRGVEIGLAHGFFMPGPFIKLGPLRAVEGTAEIAGCISAAGLVVILAVASSIYGAASFQRKEVIGIKTLTGREIARDELQTSVGWEEFTSGWVVGGLSGVAYCYLCTQFLPLYT